MFVYVNLWFPLYLSYALTLSDIKEKCSVSDVFHNYYFLNRMIQMSSLRGITVLYTAWNKWSAHTDLIFWWLNLHGVECCSDTGLRLTGGHMTHTTLRERSKQTRNESQPTSSAHKHNGKFLTLCIPAVACCACVRVYVCECVRLCVCVYMRSLSRTHTRVLGLCDWLCMPKT